MHGPVHDVVFRLLKLTMDVRRTEVTVVLCCKIFLGFDILCCFVLLSALFLTLELVINNAQQQHTLVINL